MYRLQTFLFESVWACFYSARRIYVAAVPIRAQKAEFLMIGFGHWALIRCLM